MLPDREVDSTAMANAYSARLVGCWCQSLYGLGLVTAGHASMDMRRCLRVKTAEVAL